MEYGEELIEKVKKVYDVAKAARKKKLDPAPRVEILLATELAGRVEGLVSVVVPELSGSGLRERILKLEEEYGKGNEEIGFIIAEEVASGRFHPFDSVERAIEAGLRVGIAYWTLGVTTAPLEGLTHIAIKNRLDGKKYLSIYLAGPIRSAGGTTNAMLVMLADFLRKKFGIGEYDPTHQEIERYFLEVESYHRRVTRLQYMPSAGELKFAVRNIPVEVNGEPTERIEVLAYKDLPRVETNQIRGGMVLTLSNVCLKASKLVKRMKKFGEKYDLTNWSWLEELKKKKAAKSEGGEKKTATYIAEIPGGRPVFSYPGEVGGFRLRYGRARNTGFAAIGIHPATMAILDDFIAVGTQLKLELPGKAGAAAPVDSIEGPIVRLKDRSVVRVSSEFEAKKLRKDVEKILYLGDILITYGEFLTNGHRLEQPAWCEEWWLEEVRQHIPDFSGTDVGFEEAVEISKKTGVPLHPKYTYFWENVSGEDVRKLQNALEGELSDVKDILEALGVEHFMEGGKVALKELDRKILSLVLSKKPEGAHESGIDAVNACSPVKIRRKAGR